MFRVIGSEVQRVGSGQGSCFTHTLLTVYKFVYISMHVHNEFLIYIYFLAMSHTEVWEVTLHGGGSCFGKRYENEPNIN